MITLPLRWWRRWWKAAELTGGSRTGKPNEKKDPSCPKTTLHTRNDRRSLTMLSMKHIASRPSYIDVQYQTKTVELAERNTWYRGDRSMKMKRGIKQRRC
eukprot:scaffold1588_cov214-Alexandrium_tamarense.AAC.24